jgi:hypothetical protein
VASCFATGKEFSLLYGEMQEARWLLRRRFNWREEVFSNVKGMQNLQIRMHTTLLEE